MNVVIDLSHADTRDSFHDAFVQALSLPDWYGRNLDALHDALTALGGAVVGAGATFAIGALKKKRG